ncbi:ATP-dependent DNA helicase RecQ, partial [Enterococcus faecium]
MLINDLKKYFGFDSFRPGQEEIIQALLDGEDTLAILATGTGKRLCYQLTGYLMEGLV